LGEGEGGCEGGLADWAACRKRAARFTPNMVPFSLVFANGFYNRHSFVFLSPFSSSVSLLPRSFFFQRDVLSANPDVRWGDVASNDDAKRLLKEAVVCPHLYIVYWN
jgi:hypothetical protein